MRGFNDFNWVMRKEIKKGSGVSVPMRGFNDFNKPSQEQKIKLAAVSVPMRGFNDFNLLESKIHFSNGWFPSPCGVLMILMLRECLYIRRP